MREGRWVERRKWQDHLPSGPCLVRLGETLSRRTDRISAMLSCPRHLLLVIALCGRPSVARPGVTLPSDQSSPNLTITPCSYNVPSFFDSRMRHPITLLLQASLPPRSCRKFYCARDILRNLVKCDFGVNLQAILRLLEGCCTFGSKPRGVWWG